MENQALALINVGSYTLFEKLGSGSFSSVYKAIHMSTQHIVALKCFPKSNTDNKREMILSEFRLTQSIDHPFIAATYEMFEDDNFFYMATEYAENGSLLDKINSSNGLEESLARKYFMQLIFALDYLHNTKCVAHRDIKAENILIDKDDNIKLIDFGLSSCYLDTGKNLFTTTCGSPNYVAPEVLRRTGYTQMSDIWSAGVVLYSMLAGRFPFNDPNIKTLLMQVMYMNPEYPKCISPLARDFLEKILTKDPAVRMPIHAMLLHKWISTDSSFGIYSAINSCTTRFLISGQKFDGEILKQLDEIQIFNDRADPINISCENTNFSISYKMLKRVKIMTDIKNAMCLKFPALKRNNKGQAAKSLSSDTIRSHYIMNDSSPKLLTSRRSPSPHLSCDGPLNQSAFINLRQRQSGLPSLRKPLAAKNM